MKIEFDFDENTLSKAIADYAMNSCYRKINEVVSKKETQDLIKQLAQKAVNDFMVSFNTAPLHEVLSTLVNEEVQRRVKTILRNS